MKPQCLLLKQKPQVESLKTYLEVVSLETTSLFHDHDKDT